MNFCKSRFYAHMNSSLSGHEISLYEEYTIQYSSCNLLLANFCHVLFSLVVIQKFFEHIHRRWLGKATVMYVLLESFIDHFPLWYLYIPYWNLIHILPNPMQYQTLYSGVCVCSLIVICFCLQAFRIREVSMCIIGRLSNLNPAFVMPSLRKSLIQVSLCISYMCTVFTLICYQRFLLNWSTVELVVTRNKVQDYWDTWLPMLLNLSSPIKNQYWK